jgi:hypothetical protein
MGTGYGVSMTTHLDSTWAGALWQAAPDDLYTPPVWLSGLQAGALAVQSGLAHRIVWSVAQDAMSPGWSGAPADVAGTDLVDVLAEAVGAARARGGAWLWPVRSGEGVETWAEPAGAAGEIVAVHVLTADEVVPLEWETDAASPRWGRPRVLTVSPQRDGMGWPARRIHASRLCYVPGLRAWPSQRTPLGYDIPALDLYRKAIESIERAWDSSSLMLARRAVMWIRLASEMEARTTAGADAADGLRARMDAISARMRGSDSLIWLGTGDDTGWSAPPLAGTQEVLASLVSRACAVEGIPASRLMGTPPGGLSTDDESGRRSYAALIGRTQASVVPALQQLYGLGGIEIERIEWLPQDETTEIDRATASEIRARRDATLVQVGILAPDEPRSRWDDGEEREAIDLLADLGEPDADGTA